MIRREDNKNVDSEDNKEEKERGGEIFTSAFKKTQGHNIQGR